MIRLDKYLSDMGIGTRSEVKQYLKKGLVTVNGAVEKRPERKIETGLEQVCFKDNPVTYVDYEYYMFHKPAGCVSATNDNLHKTVMDYINEAVRKDLFPVGRLDIDTEGLLLITNDGALSHRLLSPAHHVEKTYYARVEGDVTEADAALFAEGVDIGDDTPTAPAKLVILDYSSEDPVSGNPTSEIRLTITEGRYHQVKRMFEAVGKHVIYLKRLSMGGVCLDEALKPGEYRPLYAEELKQLKESP